MGRSLAGIALCAASLAIILMVLQVPREAVVQLGVWSPAVLCATALWLLVKSAVPRRIALTALTLLLAGGLGLTATHHLAGPKFWFLLLAGALAIAGATLARSGIRPATAAAPSPDRPGAAVTYRRLGRSGMLPPVAEGTNAVAVTACFADVVLELPHVGVDVVEVDATIIAGSITVLAPNLRQSDVVVHRAFVLSHGVLTTTPPQPRADVNVPLLTIVLVGLGGDVVVRCSPGDQDPPAGEAPETSGGEPAPVR